MSWWVGVEIDTGSDELHDIADRNVTYNYAPLFNAVLPHPEGLRGYNKAPCSEAGGILRRAAEDLEAMGKPKATALIRGGGSWGDYGNALDVLRWLASKCAEHPRAQVYVH